MKFRKLKIGRCEHASIEPTKGYLDALKNYPTPKCLKDMRAFSGFLNQSAFMSREKTREAMGLIRKRK